MKLKNIFLSLIAIASFTACENEELIGPTQGSQGEGQPAVLMINGSANSSLETKADAGILLKNSQPDDRENQFDELYVFVFDQAGDLLGKGYSKEGNDAKGQKVFDVLSAGYYTGDDNINKWGDAAKIATDINDISPNDVIVSGPKLLEGMTVDVVLIANPTKNIKSLYENLTSRSTLSEELATLEDQKSMYEAENGRSTACQRLSVTLKKGVNYFGKNKYASQNEGNVRAWWNNQYKDQIPLYRLISQIRLKEIHCYGEFEDMENGQDCGVNNNFVLRKAYLQKGYYDKSSLLTAPVSFDGTTVEAVAQANLFDEFCGFMQNSSVKPSLSNGDDLFKVGTTAGPLNHSVKGILITYGSSCKWDEKCSAVVWVGAMWDTRYNRTMSDLLNYAYSFESSNGAPVYLILEGYYRAGVDFNANSVINKKQYVYYAVRIPQGEDLFRRNCIYDVTVKIKGKGSNTPPPVDDPSGSEAVEVSVEIANMANANPNFVFGGE